MVKDHTNGPYAAAFRRAAVAAYFATGTGHIEANGVDVDPINDTRGFLAWCFDGVADAIAASGRPRPVQTDFKNDRRVCDIFGGLCNAVMWAELQSGHGTWGLSPDDRDAWASKEDVDFAVDLVAGTWKI